MSDPKEKQVPREIASLLKAIETLGMELDALCSAIDPVTSPPWKDTAPTTPLKETIEPICDVADSIQIATAKLNRLVDKVHERTLAVEV